jgi:hypothetical protein
MWAEIVMKVARKFGQKQWRRKDGQRTDAATQLLLLMDLMPLCDSRRCAPLTHDTHDTHDTQHTSAVVVPVGSP